MSYIKPPAVTDGEALSDAEWFDVHADRRFRARQGADGSIWLIRRYGSAFLRIETGGPMPPVDTDPALERLWFIAAYPDLAADALRRRARRKRR